MPDDKPKCPECDTQLVLVDGKPPEECQNCHFLLAGFPDFMRWLKAATKLTDAAKPKPKGRSSPFGGFGRRG